MSQHAIDNAKAWFRHIQEMVAEVAAAAEEATERYRAAGGTGGGYDDTERTETARRAIEESPLSVLVRSGWYSPSDARKVRPSDGFPLCCLPTEYEILLSTDNTGPTRIVGDLSEHGEPTSATLQWRDWGTPWTDAWPELVGIVGCWSSASSPTTSTRPGCFPAILWHVKPKTYLTASKALTCH